MIGWKKGSASLTEVLVGARASPLSRAQVEEIQALFPKLCLRPIFVETRGDRDLTTSLRTLDKTDFFTRELDQLVLLGECRIAVHSAKDLPEPLPPGLAVVHLTEGIDPRDMLVMRPGVKLENLPRGARVATSSIRREEAVRKLCPDAQFADLRGTIEKRLGLLEKGEMEGIVVAEAALIRLKLTHLNRVPLPGETAPLQGKLAIVARAGDEEITWLFAQTASDGSNADCS